ncbi:uncharacterized protein LOC122298886 [Carya illinoinensis]|uniref:uncharacterized protein LOC122298886 n=1 Tax=Carya illinoinensis TaxID=32201 RepID=UPI001C720B66|nr:uncharacterized protein LOC122298886 [Carya illinoinensis]
MAAVAGQPPMAGPSRSFAELVSSVPQPLPEVVVPFRQPKYIDGEPFFSFSAEEVAKTAEPFRFSMVVKFLRQRPSLDSIHAFIRNRWGLSSLPVVSAMQRPRNIFIRMSSESDLHKALSRESCDIDGIPYRAFAWSPDFDEDFEPPTVPVWVFLPGLPPNFYHSSLLKMLTAPIGNYIRRDNPTKCATRTDGARICLEIDASQQPISHFWIGIPGMPRSRRQEILYETLPTYCLNCRCQGHNQSTCRNGGEKKQTVKGRKIWKPKAGNPSAKEDNVNGGLQITVEVSNSDNIEKRVEPFVGIVTAEQGEPSNPQLEHSKLVAAEALQSLEDTEKMQEESEKTALKEAVPVLVGEPIPMVDLSLDRHAQVDAAGPGIVCTSMTGLCEKNYKGMLLYSGAEVLGGILNSMDPEPVDTTLEHGKTGQISKAQPNPIIIEEIEEDDADDMVHDGPAMVSDESAPLCEEIERKTTCSDGQVCSDTDSEGPLEHLAKNNLVVSDSDIPSGLKRNGKGIKLRGSSRVVSKPSRLNL